MDLQIIVFLLCPNFFGNRFVLVLTYKSIKKNISRKRGKNICSFLLFL